MSEIEEIDAFGPQSKPVVKLEREASHLEAEIVDHFIGRVNEISPKLKGEASKIYSVGSKSLMDISRSAEVGRFPEAKVQDEVTLYPLLLVTDSRLYLKLVRARADEMEKAVQKDRALMRLKVYWADLKDKFHEFLERIELQQHDLIPRPIPTPKK